MTKLDEHRSRVPGSTDRGSTFHSEETLVLVHAVTLAPGAWPRTITNDKCEVQPSSTRHTIWRYVLYKPRIQRVTSSGESESNQKSMASEETDRRGVWRRKRTSEEECADEIVL